VLPHRWALVADQVGHRQDRRAAEFERNGPGSRPIQAPPSLTARAACRVEIEGGDRRALGGSITRKKRTSGCQVGWLPHRRARSGCRTDGPQRAKEAFRARGSEPVAAGLSLSRSKAPPGNTRPERRIPGLGNRWASGRRGGPGAGLKVRPARPRRSARRRTQVFKQGPPLPPPRPAIFLSRGWIGPMGGNKARGPAHPRSVEDAADQRLVVEFSPLGRPAPHGPCRPGPAGHGDGCYFRTARKRACRGPSSQRPHRRVTGPAAWAS